MATATSTRVYTATETVTVIVTVGVSDPVTGVATTPDWTASSTIPAILPTVTIPSFTCPDNHQQVIANWISGQQYKYQVFCDALVVGVGALSSYNYSSPADCAAACSELDFRLNGTTCKAMSFNATATSGDNCFLYGDVPALINSPGVISALLSEIVLSNGAPFLSANSTGTRAPSPEDTSSAISAVADPAVITAPPASCPATVGSSTYWSSGITLENGWYSYSWSWAAYTAECWISSWATATTQVYASTWTVVIPGQSGISGGAVASASAGAGGGVSLGGGGVVTFVSNGVTVVSTIASAGATGGGGGGASAGATGSGIPSPTAAASGAVPTIIVTNETTIVSFISDATGSAGSSATGGVGGGLVPFPNATTVLSDGSTLVYNTGGVDIGFTTGGATVVLSTGGVDVSLVGSASSGGGGGLIPPSLTAPGVPDSTAVITSGASVVLSTGGVDLSFASSEFSTGGSGLIPPAPSGAPPTFANSTNIGVESTALTYPIGQIVTGPVGTGLSTGGSGPIPPTSGSPAFPNITAVESAATTAVLGTGGVDIGFISTGTAVTGGGLIPPSSGSPAFPNITAVESTASTAVIGTGGVDTGFLSTGTANSTGPSGTEAPPLGTGGETAPLTTGGPTAPLITEGPTAPLTTGDSTSSSTNDTSAGSYGAPGGSRAGTIRTSSSGMIFVTTEVPTAPLFPTASMNTSDMGVGPTGGSASDMWSSGFTLSPTGSTPFPPLSTGFNDTAPFPPLSTGFNGTVPFTCPCLPQPTCPPVPTSTVTVREYITVTNCAGCPPGSLSTGGPSYGPLNTTMALRRAFGETATEAQIAAACANTGSLVTNGGFETTSQDFGAQGWTDSTTSTSIYFLTHSSATAHGGLREGRFVSSEAAATIRISQPLTLCPGTMYALSAYHRQTSDLMQCEVWYKLGGEEVFSDQPGTVYEGQSNFYTAGDSAADVSVDFDITVRCSGQTDVDGQMVLDVDDVALRAV
ncbi:hypothetical protein H2199_005933 [Coniosporium tulheliwenetii]|uniref:Uncharacterized protein n=1 Tax=Coniosporium tulheliwenetii TaxID=3383036 RepID=A0ACC2YYK2_9PEZI|nr:hypothetical protein H2199_005933 [Cladosporium sp. JES 115]